MFHNMSWDLQANWFFFRLSFCLWVSLFWPIFAHTIVMFISTYEIYLTVCLLLFPCRRPSEYSDIDLFAPFHSFSELFLTVLAQVDHDNHNLQSFPNLQEIFYKEFKVNTLHDFQVNHDRGTTTEQCPLQSKLKSKGGNGKKIQWGGAGRIKDNYISIPTSSLWLHSRGCVVSLFNRNLIMK